MLLAIAIASTVVALVMSGVAWRSTRAERARSAARVEMLARAIDGDASPAEPGRPAVLSAPHADGVGSRLGLSLAAGAFVVTTAAAAAIVLSSESPRASVGPPPAVSNAAATTVPLELVSLDHERDGDALVVRGVIRNPSSGAPREGLAAIVSTVGADGRVAASVRAAVDAPALVPGGQSAFTVTIPHAGAVARYRVSFRAGDGVVPHVDKRIGS